MPVKITVIRVCYTKIPRRRKAGKKSLSMISFPVFNRSKKIG
jgi:hypothetical protein